MLDRPNELSMEVKNTHEKNSANLIAGKNHSLDSCELIQKVEGVNTLESLDKSTGKKQHITVKQNLDPSSSLLEAAISNSGQKGEASPGG